MGTLSDAYAAVALSRILEWAGKWKSRAPSSHSEHPNSSLLVDDSRKTVGLESVQVLEGTSAAPKVIKTSKTPKIATTSTASEVQTKPAGPEVANALAVGKVANTVGVPKMATSSATAELANSSAAVMVATTSSSYEMASFSSDADVTTVEDEAETDRPVTEVFVTTTNVEMTRSCYSPPMKAHFSGSRTTESVHIMQQPHSQHLLRRTPSLPLKVSTIFQVRSF